jgi:uncharacterized membrane protein YeaQ/YmgE (transglycosylase-associated protein family)
MSLLAWIVFGIVVGVIANAIDPEPTRGGIVGALVLGVLGALVGGFLASALIGIGVSGFNLTSLVVAIGGSLLLLFIGRALSRA